MQYGRNRGTACLIAASLLLLSSNDIVKQSEAFFKTAVAAGTDELQTKSNVSEIAKIHKYILQANSSNAEDKAHNPKSKALAAKRRARDSRREALLRSKEKLEESLGSTEHKKSRTSKGTGVREVLENSSIKEVASQAEGMLVAGKQALIGQEKAVIQQPVNDSDLLPSRERNPSILEAVRTSHENHLSHASKNLIMKSTELLAGNLPKVALLFLTRGPMPLETTWRIFLESIPLQGPGDQPGWKTLFSMYTHPGVEFSYPNDSLFFGTEVDNRITVEWGQFSVMAAEIRLFESALQDPLNERLVLLSETCIPIFPATVVWGELLSEGLSRINACANPEDPNDYNTRMAYRQAEEMVQKGLEREYWRKSSQWAMLTRAHAEIIANDTTVRPIFESECYIEDGKRFCVADEHYMATALSKMELENQTDCLGFVTHAWWDGNYAHPRTWQLADISQSLILKLRRSVHAEEPHTGPCLCEEAVSTAGLVFPEMVNVSAVHQRRALLQQKDPSKMSRPNTPSSIASFQEQLAVLQPYSSAWWEFLSSHGISTQEIEDNAYQEELAMSVSRRRRHLVAERIRGIRHQEQGSHWDLAREFLEDYEAMNDKGCPLFARKFLGDAGEALAEMAAKLGTLEQAFLAADAAGEY